MTHSEFMSAISNKEIPSSPLLQILYYDQIGDWEKAHDIANNLGGREGDLLHAYLHRKEGDSWNARYWYSRLNLEYPTISLLDEWSNLSKQFTE